MKIGVVSELTGGADICQSVADLSSVQANAYLAPTERVLFALASPKEEYAFTNEALIAVCGDSAMSTKRTVTRLEYISERVTHVLFETGGVTDRDCELKFRMGAQAFSIDITKAEQPRAQHFYRVLQELSRAQTENARGWDFAKSALDAAVRSTQVVHGQAAAAVATGDATASSGATSGLVDQATSVQTWLVEAFSKTNPRCYGAVIHAALERVES